MESVVVQTVADDFRIDVRITCLRMFILFEYKAGCAFAHDESVTILVERTTSNRRMRPAHRSDKCEGSVGQRAQGSFGRPRDNDIGPTFADVSERLPNCNVAARATIGVGGSYTAKSELNGRVTMGRAAEDLQGQGLMDRLGTAVDESLVLTFRIRDAAKRGSKLTPTRFCGVSGEYSNPLSSSASLTDATENCAYRSNRFKR